MNDSLLTYSGGQPLYADDLSFMQNSLSAMTNHLSKAFGDTYIVWGCLDEGKTNVIEGAVCIGGKLYEVPALGTLGENKLCYREVQSDERVFEDGQKRNVKKSYEAYLSTDTSGAVAYIDLKTARSASLLEAEWDDTPYIEATPFHWRNPVIKRIRTLGGWLYFVSIKHEQSEFIVNKEDVGDIKGVTINNNISTVSYLDLDEGGKVPVVIRIFSKDSATPQGIYTYIPGTEYSPIWTDRSTNYKKDFKLEFTFFDPDVVIFT